MGAILAKGLSGNSTPTLTRAPPPQRPSLSAHPFVKLATAGPTVAVKSNSYAEKEEHLQYTQHNNNNVSITTNNSSPASKVGKCSCPEEVRKSNTDYCEAGGCGKPLYYCAECFQFIKMKGDNCSCSWAKKKLLAKQKEKNSNFN